MKLNSNEINSLHDFMADRYADFEGNEILEGIFTKLETYTTTEYCSDCGKDLSNVTAYSCDSEPCILEGSDIGLLCEICATNHGVQNQNHEVTKIK